jgi:integrase
MVKEFSMISLFEKFIRDTEKGRRRKLNGDRIKKQTTECYRYTLKLLSEFEAVRRELLLVNINFRNNQALLNKERQRWDRFYSDFSRYLYYKKGCHDNYCGHTFKHIKCFIRYLRNERFMAVPDFERRFYVRKEEFEIVTLLPERFIFLVHEEAFVEKLNGKQKRCRELFIFGCITALRYSDLMNLRVRDLEHRGLDYYLNYRTLKTNTLVKVKLPDFARQIFDKYSRRKKASAKLFPYVSLFWFNENLKRIGRLAGWTENVGKFRTVEGEQTELKRKANLSYRFCDLLSSHVMRRTGITILLMMGMPEYLVRKISGHSAHSKSFFRYVNFAQSYISEEITIVHQKLKAMYQPEI